jgi:NAD(P)-dependent dehydrogenase (short-subunit alcohol dehydrogenase family)
MATWLITGCSTGLGRALAQAVLAAGHNAVVTARNAAAVEDIAAAHPETGLVLPLDVTNTAQKRTTATSGVCSTRTFSARWT